MNKNEAVAAMLRDVLSHSYLSGYTEEIVRAYRMHQLREAEIVRAKEEGLV